jgi:hypothetical protein
MKIMIRYVAGVLAVLVLAGAATAAAPAGAAAAGGGAKGTFSADGKTFTLAYGAAFVDQKDERKPTILLITDQALPVASWKSDFDIINYRNDKHEFNGVAFWLDKKGAVYKSSFYAGDFPTSTSGYFDLKLDGPMGKSLAGSVKSTEAAAAGRHKVTLAATFNTTLK